MTELALPLPRSSAFLRNVLLVDAATSLAAGVVMLLGAGTLTELLGLPEPLLRYAGAGLLPFAALVAFIATRLNISRSAVWAIIAANAIWVVDSVLLLLVGPVEPTILGYAFVAAQACAVGLLAELEYVGVRES